MLKFQIWHISPLTILWGWVSLSLTQLKSVSLLSVLLTFLSLNLTGFIPDHILDQVLTCNGRLTHTFLGYVKWKFSTFCGLSGTTTYQKLPQRTIDHLDLCNYFARLFFGFWGSSKPKTTTNKQTNERSKFLFVFAKSGYFVIIFLILI